MKTFLKTTFLYDIFLNIRKNLRIIYSTKSRSRFFWNLNKGDEVLSFDYKLDQSSIVFVIGAFEGDYLGKLNDRFKCKIYAFEPIDEYFNTLNNKFEKFKNINLFNFGLSDKTENVKFSKIGESSTEYGDNSNLVDVNLKSIKEFLLEKKIRNIDLIYMNIEGGEYSVLRQLLDIGFLNNVKHLQVQYHKVDDDSPSKRRKVNKKIAISHSRKFNYPFIWERWDLNG